MRVLQVDAESRHCLEVVQAAFQLPPRDHQLNGHCARRERLRRMRQTLCGPGALAGERFDGGDCADGRRQADVRGGRGGTRLLIRERRRQRPEGQCVRLCARRRGSGGTLTVWMAWLTRLGIAADVREWLVVICAADTREGVVRTGHGLLILSDHPSEVGWHDPVQCPDVLTSGAL